MLLPLSPRVTPMIYQHYLLVSRTTRFFGRTIESIIAIRYWWFQSSWSPLWYIFRFRMVKVGRYDTPSPLLLVYLFLFFIFRLPYSTVLRFWLLVVWSGDTIRHCFCFGINHVTNHWLWRKNHTTMLMMMIMIMIGKKKMYSMLVTTLLFLFLVVLFHEPHLMPFPYSHRRRLTYGKEILGESKDLGEIGMKM